METICGYPQWKKVPAFKRPIIKKKLGIEAKK